MVNIDKTTKVMRTSTTLWGLRYMIGVARFGHIDQCVERHGDLMVNKTVITFGIFTLAQGNRLAPQGRPGQSPIRRWFRPRCAQARLSPSVGTLANLGPDGTT